MGDTLKKLVEVAEHLRIKLENQLRPSLFPAEELADRVIEAKNKRGQTKEGLSVKLDKLREKSRIVTGFHDIYGPIYKLLGYNANLTKRHKAAENALFHITMGRLASPQSKRATVSLLAKDFGVGISLDKGY